MISDRPMHKYFDSLRFLEHMKVQQLVVIPPESVLANGHGDGEEASLFDRIFRSCSGKYFVVSK